MIKKGEKYECEFWDGKWFTIGNVYESDKDDYLISNENISVNIQLNKDDLKHFKLVTEKQLSKYHVECKGVQIDVYDVLSAFKVTDPALQHLIKKALKCGDRGHKDLETDLNDILKSAKRALELNGF